MHLRWSRQLTGAAATAVLLDTPFDVVAPVVLTGHADGRVRTWAVLDGNEADLALDLKGGAVRCLACVERALVCADDDGSLTHLTMRRISAQRKLSDSAVQAMCAHRDATHAWQTVCATRDGFVRCERDGTALWTLAGMATAALQSFAVLGGSYVLASDGVSAAARLLSASGVVLRTIALPEPVCSGWAIVGGDAFGGTRSGAIVRIDGTTLKCASRCVFVCIVLTTFHVAGRLSFAAQWGSPCCAWPPCCPTAWQWPARLRNCSCGTLRRMPVREWLWRCLRRVMRCHRMERVCVR